MEKVEFEENLKKIYKILEEYTKEFNSFYECLNDKCDKRDLIDNFLEKNQIQINSESRVAMASRIAFLKDESLVQFLKKNKFEEARIIKIRQNGYNLVKDYYNTKFSDIILEIENQNLITPFYLEVLKGVHRVGLEMNNLHIKWNEHIINTINLQLEKEFNNNQDKIMNFLEKNNLLEKGHFGEIADRTYSALYKDETGKYNNVAYSEVFRDQVIKVVLELNKFKDNLIILKDDIYNQKQEYLNYIQKLIDAFLEDDVNKLISRWADVDEAWMQIKTPFQIGHPLEFYEDHYRKAVAIEWDLRLQNPNTLENQRVISIKNMYKKLFNKLNENFKYSKVYQLSLENLDRVQLYLGRPAVYYGASYNGLFSAQVVPNDMVISEKYGKKIFAFADMVLENKRANPFTKLQSLIYEKSFLEESRKFTFQETKKWHEIYDIETIGHEYGHILWLDEDSEVLMNKSGNFKNIEEFKATTGGLVSFFLNEVEELKKDIIFEHIRRCVGLNAWMQVGETRPYYCEGLIHLEGLFETKLIEFNGEKVIINYCEENYEKIKQWYLNTYTKLAKHYLEKKDASEFLFDYVEIVDNKYLPKNLEIRKFVEYFYEQYKEFGNIIDTEDKKENYIF